MQSNAVIQFTSEENRYKLKLTTFQLNNNLYTNWRVTEKNHLHTWFMGIKLKSMAINHFSCFTWETWGGGNINHIVFHLCTLTNKQYNIEVTCHSGQHQRFGGKVAMGRVSLGTLDVPYHFFHHRCSLFTFIYLPTEVHGPDTDTVAE